MLRISRNLLRISRKKDQGNEPIYLRFFSTIIDWKHEVLVSPYHFIKLGLENTKKEVNCPMELLEKEFNTEELSIEQRQILSQIYYELRRLIILKKLKSITLLAR